MGYELYVSEARFADIKPGEPLKLGVTIENRGVAPFYYPWRVVVGVANDKNQIVASWYANWDLREIQPKTIAVFPDWKVSGDPKELPFAAPRQFGFSTQHQLAPGKYRLFLRVVNPLETVTPKPKSPPLPLRFANLAQLPNGWLPLGDLAVKQ
jgi:hypothetical protein